MQLAVDPGLPPLRTEPLTPKEIESLSFSFRERELMAERIKGEPIYFAYLSGARVDVGGWFGKKRIWVLAMKDRLVLFTTHYNTFIEWCARWQPRRKFLRIVAALLRKLTCLRTFFGKWPFFEEIPFESIQASSFNHVMSEVVLLPQDGLKVPRLRMAPLEGFLLLAQIKQHED